MWLRSRRELLSVPAAGVTLGLVSTAQGAASLPGPGGLNEKILSAVRALPGAKALQIWSPGDVDCPAWGVSLNPGHALFCGSAFKVFVLAEFLRQAEATGLAPALDTEWRLDESIWSPISPVFNPPYLKGRVRALTALQAMIARSDNTGTDMALLHTGVDAVRDFVRAIGLGSARIPTSTRQFVAYLLGVRDYQHITWDELIRLLDSDAPFVNPIINDVETMACSPHDFVLFYSRALQGAFFRDKATLARFRSILMLADAIPLAIPLGVTAFMKGGSIDAKPQHALSIAGGCYFPHRWVYFGLTVNWRADSDGPGETGPLFGKTALDIFTWIQEALGT